MRSFKFGQIPKPTGPIFWPMDGAFSRRAFEIGAGTGEFGLGFATQNPDCFLLSVERTKNKSDRFFDQSEKPSNFEFVRGDAINILVHIIPDASLDLVFLLYPNPYPKKKQSNQRWHNMSFIQALKTKMKPQAILELRTNLPFYHEEAKSRFQTLHGLKLKQEFELKDATQAQTAFERKYLSRGEICYRSLYSIG